MSRRHQVREDLHPRTIAQRSGFQSTRAIETYSENASLVAQRGGVDLLEPGDELSIPEGTVGQRAVGTGRVHQVTVARTTTVFEVRVYVEFRLPVPGRPGDKNETRQRWQSFGHGDPLSQIVATVTVSAHGSKTPVAGSPRATHPRRGTVELPGLPDGTWQVLVEPSPEETSPGPAGANPGGDHGIKTGPRRNNGHYQLEFRPLLLSVTVAGGAITGAEVATHKPDRRPHHAVPFWISVGESPTRQVLEIDWRPDYLRRFRPNGADLLIRPKQVQRSPKWEDLPNGRHLIIVHHTAGDTIGGAFNTFLHKNITSGAQFLVDVDGHIVRMADDRYWTKHGGGGGDIRPPSWDNLTRPTVNDRALGIETVHGGTVDQLFGEPAMKRPFQPAQYDALVDLIGGLQRAYSVTPRRVIGHQDATLKGGCPSPFFEWEHLEKAGVALAPESLSEADLDEMFGGFFAGPAGRDRKLFLGSKESSVGSPPKHTVELAGSGGSVPDLVAAPIEALRTALVEIGYGCALSPGIFVVHEKTKKKALPVEHEFDYVLGFCLCQFVRRYCTGSRLRSDEGMKSAYRDAPRVPDGLFLDFSLAMLVKGAEKAARKIRAEESGA